MTKTGLSFALTLLPSLAFADHGGMGQCASHMSGCGHSGALGILAMAAVAALGCYVLRQGSKDAGATGWASKIVGWVLVAGGLFAFLALGCEKMRSMCHKSGSASMCPMSGKTM